MNPVFDKVYAPPRFTEVLPLCHAQILLGFYASCVTSVSKKGHNIDFFSPSRIIFTITPK